MTAEHKLPLVAFLALSALCLLVAAVGLSGPASRLPGVPAGPASLLAGAPPAHLVGDVLVGRTSTPVPLGNDHPVVPSSVALPVTAPAGVLVEPTAATVTRSAPTTQHRARSTVHHRTGHRSARRVQSPTAGPGRHAAVRPVVALRAQRAVPQRAVPQRAVRHRAAAHRTNGHRANGHRHHPARHRGWHHRHR